MSVAGAYRLRHVAVALTGRELPAALMALCQRHADGDGPPEFHGLFIEDSDLLKAAALPFTFEFCTLTTLMRPLTAADLEAHYVREAQAAAREFAALAARAGFRWQFEVVRSRKFTAVLAALASADATLVPAARAERHGAPAGPAVILAIADDSTAGARTLALATRLAEAEGVPLEFCKVVEAGAAAVAGAPAGRLVRDDRQALRALLARSDPELTVLAAPVLDWLEHGQRELQDQIGAALLVVA